MSKKGKAFLVREATADQRKLSLRVGSGHGVRWRLGGTWSVTGDLASGVVAGVLGRGSVQCL